jgi:hypothetical protein
MTGEEKGKQADYVDGVMKTDDDRHVIAWLDARVPHEVPAELTSAIRSSVTAELQVITSETATQSASAAASAPFIGRRMPSLGIATAAMIVFFMGLNTLITWRSDQRVAALVGDDGARDRSETMTHGTEQLAVKKIGVFAFFEFNVSLIQQELNHERIESHSASARGRRPKAIDPPEKKTLEENLDRSGAATSPGPGIQRFSKLAGRFTA